MCIRDRPDTGGPTVALHEGVGNVHFDVFRNYFLKGCFRHLLDHREDGTQIKAICKSETTLCDIQRRDFAGKVVQPTEQIAVNLTKPGHGSDLYAVDVPRFE